MTQSTSSSTQPAPTAEVRLAFDGVIGDEAGVLEFGEVEVEGGGRCQATKGFRFPLPNPHIPFSSLFRLFHHYESPNSAAQGVTMVCCLMLQYFLMASNHELVGRKGQDREPHARAAHPEARPEHQCRRVW